MLFSGMFRKVPAGGYDRHDVPAKQPDLHPVTIIICARNEARNLEKNLPSILAQRYANANGVPLFEVLVVNDASTDDTALVLQYFEKEYSHLRHLTITPEEFRDFPGKKFALNRGVAAAQHDWLLLTDADCEPVTEFWLDLMTAPLQEGKSIVAGYGAYRKEKTLLNAFVRWETVHTFLQYSRYAEAGVPYMAVGRNLACTRSMILAAKGHPAWSNLPSGDDDLMVSALATAENIAVVQNRDAFTYSEAKQTWKEYAVQKRRHLSTGKYYKTFPKRLLGLYALSHGAMWLLFFILLFVQGWGMAFLLVLLRCTLYWALWTQTARRLRERYLWYWFPLFDIGWLIYNFAFAPYILWKNKQQWK